MPFIDSGSSVRKDVEVRILSWAPNDPWHRGIRRSFPLFRLCASRLDRRDEGPAAKYLGRSRRAGQYYSAVRIFVLWFPCESAEVSSARNRFSALYLSGTQPLRIDILSMEQQHFVLLRRFSLDRNFTVVYITPSDSGDRDSASGRPIHPGSTATSSDATCRVKPRHRGGSATPRRMRSQRCRRDIAQINRRSEELLGTQGELFSFSDVSELLANRI